MIPCFVPNLRRFHPASRCLERALPYPYVGGGVAIATGDNDDIGPLVTAGVDFGLTLNSATAAVNVVF